MIHNEKVTKILYGGDYNPEQWPEEVWQTDMQLFAQAGIDVVTLNVFSWAALQPNEETYDFSKLDKIMQMASSHNLKVCLATSTAAHPAWMARRYPDILRTGPDGMKRKFGARHNSCPNSPTYRKYAVALARQLARRYGHYDNLVAWHVSNEYGGECYCENCEKAFRVWLRKKYGTLEALNHAWNTAFWGHTFYDWDEIVLPDLRSEEFMYGSTVRTNFQGISLDYRRFNSDSLLECYCLERDALREVTPQVPVTTNLMGYYYGLDYQKWGKEMDFISWDSYPEYGEPEGKNAMWHDVMRGAGGGAPFALMEQSPSISNWHAYCALKRPGVMRLYSYQAVAHGADTVMFFQMRRSVGACEKFHSAVIDHVGHGETRQFRELAALGRELKQLGGLTLGGRTPAQAAIVFDWDNWWATSLSAGPSVEINYPEEVYRWYDGLARHNIPVDFVGVDQDLSGYKVVFAPMLYMCKGAHHQALTRYVEEGGTLVSTYFSGYVEEHDLVVCGGYPGHLKKVLGIWVEESDALPPQEHNCFTWNGKEYPARVLCDLLHLQGAQALACYGAQFYAGMPALTCNRLGKGASYYVATSSDREFYRDFVGHLRDTCGLEPVHDTPEGVEAALRCNGQGEFLFFLNYNDAPKGVRLARSGVELLSRRQYQAGDWLELEGKGVAILHTAGEGHRG